MSKTYWRVSYNGLGIYDAFRLGKKIFLWNEIPDGILKDEIDGFSPIIINGDLDLLK